MTRPGTTRFQRALFPAITMTYLALFALRIGPIAAGEGRAADQGGWSPPTLDEIAAAMKGQWDRVENLRVDYNEKTEGLVDFKFIKRYLGYNGTTDLDKSYAFKGPKRYYRLKNNRKLDIDLAYDTEFDQGVIASGQEATNPRPGEPVKPSPPMPKLPREMPTIGESESAWDGTRFLQKLPGGSGGMDDATATVKINDPSNLPDDLIQMPQDYLVGLGRTLPDPLHPEHDRRDRRLPDAFGLGGFEVRSTFQEVDGSPCVVVTRPGQETYWLDPKVNYGVRKYERLTPRSDVVRERRQNRDFAEVAPGIWLPRVCTRDLCGPPLAPAPFRGAPMLRFTYKLTGWKLNNLPDSLFELKIKPGVLVADATRLPSKGDENQYVTYRMPADASQLEKAVEQALSEKANFEAKKEQDTQRRVAIVWVNGVITAIIFVPLLAWLVRRKRSTKAFQP
jgi:hypothetical protein